MTQGFVGEPGDVLKGLSGAIETAVTFEVDSYRGYGTDRKALVVIKLVDTGRLVKTVSTSRPLFGLERGQKVRIVHATVTGHDNYRGQDQTVVNRIKLEEIP